MDDITYRTATTDLDPSDARFVAAAALHVAIHAPIFLVDPPAMRAEHVLDRDAMTASWFAVRDAIRAAQPHPRATTFAPLVADFVDAFRRSFGSGDGLSPAVAGTGSLTQATSYRALLNRLPELADNLAQSAARWGTIPARSQIADVEPIPWRDHTGVQRYAAIRPSLLTATVSAAIAQAALDAARASALAAAHADASAGRVGEQPHPRLVQAHLDRVSQPKPTRESSWDRDVSEIDHRITADATWPVLARILDLAADDGWDVRAHLRQIATDLPSVQPAAELAYRIIAVESFEPTETPEPSAASCASDDDYPSPSITIMPPREPLGPSR